LGWVGGGFKNGGYEIKTDYIVKTRRKSIMEETVKKALVNKTKL